MCACMSMCVYANEHDFATEVCLMHTNSVCDIHLSTSIRTILENKPGAVKGNLIDSTYVSTTQVCIVLTWKLEAIVEEKMLTSLCIHSYLTTLAFLG